MLLTADKSALTARLGLQPILISIGLLFCVFASLQWEARSHKGMDFYQFWIVPTIMQDQPAQVVKKYATPEFRSEYGEQYYQESLQTTEPRFRNVAQSRRVLETLSTPFLYVVFDLFAGNGYEADYLRYQAVCNVLGLLAVVALAVNFGFSVLEGAAFAALLSVSWDPWGSELRTANINRLLLVVLALATWLLRDSNRSRARLRTGVLFGMAVLFKPILMGPALAPVVMQLFRKNWKAVGEWVRGGAIGGAVAAILSAWYFGDWKVWLTWHQNFSEMDSDLVASYRGNYSFLLFLYEKYSISMAVGAVSVLAFGVAVALLLAKRYSGTGLLSVERAQREAELEIFAVCAGMLAYCLLSFLVWYHYFVTLIPLALFLLRPRSEGTPQLWSRRAQCALTMVALIGCGGFVPLYLFGPVVPVEVQTKLMISMYLALAIAVVIEVRSNAVERANAC